MTRTAARQRNYGNGAQAWRFEVRGDQKDAAPKVTAMTTDRLFDSKPSTLKQRRQQATE